MPTKQLDAIVQGIFSQVSAQIDCTKWGNYCEKILPILDREDMALFAKGLSMPLGRFQDRYLTKQEKSPSTYILNALPCPFFTDHHWTYYGYRPKACRSYPHLQKSGFTTRLIDTISN